MGCCSPDRACAQSPLPVQHSLSVVHHASVQRRKTPTPHASPYSFPMVIRRVEVKSAASSPQPSIQFGLSQKVIRSVPLQLCPAGECLGTRPRGAFGVLPGACLRLLNGRWLDGVHRGEEAEGAQGWAACERPCGGRCARGAHCRPPGCRVRPDAPRGGRSGACGSAG